MLSDRSLLHETAPRGLIRIENSDNLTDRIQPASIDIRLGSKFQVMKSQRRMGGTPMDLRKSTDDFFSEINVKDDNGFSMQPGACVLATTMETVTLPSNVVARVEGKSSLGRLFLLVHATAGFIDPGFSGEVTLELVNLGKHEMILYPGMPIAQLAFHWLDTASMAGYAGKYQGLKGPALPQFWKNFPLEES